MQIERFFGSSLFKRENKKVYRRLNLEMEKFNLEKHDFIELNKLLKILGWVASGGEAKQVIDEELVAVNGEVETRRRKKLIKGDVIKYQENESLIE